jgi:hypothetical protein
LLFFLATRSHNMTKCGGFSFFYWIYYADFKMRPKLLQWMFLAQDRIVQNSLRISYEIVDTCVLRMIFLKNEQTISTCSSNMVCFQLNQLDFVYFLSGGKKCFTRWYIQNAFTFSSTLLIVLLQNLTKYEINLQVLLKINSWKILTEVFMENN